MRGWKIALIGGVLLVLAAGLLFGHQVLLRPLTLPVYVFDQPDWAQQGVAITTLSYGNSLYESGLAEQALEATATGFFQQKQIGRTQDGLDVYAVAGQPASDYILLMTEMFPSMIFRNAELPALTLANYPAEEIQLLREMRGAPVRSTADPEMIREVIDSLAQQPGTTRRMQPERVMFVRLTSTKLPGLGYALYTSQTQDGKVYLAETTDPELWFLAGAAFRGWVQQP